MSPSQRPHHGDREESGAQKRGKSLAQWSDWIPIASNSPAPEIEKMHRDGDALRFMMWINHVKSKCECMWDLALLKLNLSFNTSQSRACWISSSVSPSPSMMEDFVTTSGRALRLNHINHFVTSHLFDPSICLTQPWCIFWSFDFWFLFVCALFGLLCPLSVVCH